MSSRERGSWDDDGAVGAAHLTIPTPMCGNERGGASSRERGSWDDDGAVGAAHSTIRTPACGNERRGDEERRAEERGGPGNVVDRLSMITWKDVATGRRWQKDVKVNGQV
eukprot:365200-Chlamydomonas_euryale.AAC.2